MAYKALYRTYRPQTFEEVAGQNHIVRTLKNALETNKIAHAYLFCGPRGTGKTTMAKLFAKALNCEQGIGHQCNECLSCKEIINGSHPDVIEIDAASNNGVEQVRDLINKVGYLPMEGKYKVYIIDEVHMMTASAFNALLKTLEEPPAHVIFILATTEPHQILPTILSRCQRYDFTKVGDNDIANRLIKVLESENVEYEDPAIDAIVSLADGGMRDALSILDQILAYSGNQLHEDDVYTLFGLTSKADKIDFLKSLVKGDASRCLELINGYFQGGVDLKRLNLGLLNILKDVLVIKVTRDEDQMQVLNTVEALDLGQHLSIETTNEMISTLLKTQSDFKGVDNIKTLFEITILKLCSLHATNVAPVQPQIIAQEPKIQPKPAVTPSPRVEEQSKIEVKPEPKVEIKKEPAPIPDFLLEDETSVVKSEISIEGDMNSLDDETLVTIMAGGSKPLRLAVTEKWTLLANLTTHKQFGAIAALLKDTVPYVVANNVLVLISDFDRITKRINIKDNQEAISTLVNKITGLNCFIYGITRSDKVRLMYNYQSKKQLNQLPDSKAVEQINFKEI